MAELNQTFSIKQFFATVCVSILTAVAVASHAAAQSTTAQTPPANADPKAVFLQYLGSPSYKHLLERVLNAGKPPALKQECPSLQLLEWNKAQIIQQPTFVAAAGGGLNVDSGASVAVVAANRCGSRVIRRALLKAVPGQNFVQPTFLMPGDFRGNLKLELDARRIVFPGLAAFGQCSDATKVQVLDVRPLTPASPQGWSETWTAKACDRSVDATVTYSATADGMDIRAGNFKLH
jgi:hypothetical protein